MMPDIKKCNVIDCFYNRDNICHAEAITAEGIELSLHGQEPDCDTFVT